MKLGIDMAIAMSMLSRYGLCEIDIFGAWKDSNSRPFGLTNKQLRKINDLHAITCACDLRVLTRPDNITLYSMRPFGPP